MSRFYGNLKGSRREATRQGTSQSGISGHIRGWNTGVRVEIYDANGKDVVRIFRTDGSRGGGSNQIVSWVDDGPATYKV